MTRWPHRAGAAAGIRGGDWPGASLGPYTAMAMPAAPTLIAISVGNSRTHLGRFEDGSLVETARLVNDELPPIVERILQWRATIADTPTMIAMATVDPPVSERLLSMLQDQLAEDVYRIGDDLPVPIGRQLDPETITGDDRLLNAAAAYDRIKQACVIIDAGTAVTVDFVDGEGTFHGGAIAPGARMQLRALHEYTASLPELDFNKPDDETFGRSTAQAMLKGVYFSIRGLVWRLAEAYAERYGAYPQIVATGGDAELLFQDDELVDNIVPDLALLGIAAAVKHALARDPD